jgi:L-fucose mutarotase
MLTGRLIHPQILEALGRAGHSAKVLIADGNYPASTKRPSGAALVSLNLSPGVVDCVQVLSAVAAAIPIEAAAVMRPERTGPYAMEEDPEIWQAFRTVLAGAEVDVDLEPRDRFAFYEAASSDDVALLIVTGEQRLYANLLLTIGVVMPRG